MLVLQHISSYLMNCRFNSGKSKDIHRVNGVLTARPSMSGAQFIPKMEESDSKHAGGTGILRRSAAKTERLISSLDSRRSPLNMLIQVALQHDAQALIL